MDLLMQLNVVNNNFSVHESSLSINSLMSTKEDDSPLVSCVNCQMPIAMLSMREHQLECGGGGSRQDLKEHAKPR